MRVVESKVSDKNRKIVLCVVERTVFRLLSIGQFSLGRLILQTLNPTRMKFNQFLMPAL